MSPKKPPHHVPKGPPPGIEIPHEVVLREKKNDLWRIIVAFVLGSFIALFVGGILFFLNIHINVILPVLAPVWIGMITITLMLTKEKEGK
ncbi:hypothetical protein KKC60_05245 [Patescibacteria group bacterium]|nr:hypothetical protein [Patescibacteria group bacterium]